MRGTLLVKPKSAQLTYNTELTGTMDPFVELTIGSQKRKTAVAKNAGKLPAWVDEFEFQLQGDEIIKYVVYDHDTFSRNDLIGEGTFQLSKLQNGSRVLESLPIIRKGKGAGQLVIEFQLFNH